MSPEEGSRLVNVRLEEIKRGHAIMLSLGDSSAYVQSMRETKRMYTAMLNGQLLRGGFENGIVGEWQVELSAVCQFLDSLEK